MHSYVEYLYMVPGHRQNLFSGGGCDLGPCKNAQEDKRRVERQLKARRPLVKLGGLAPIEAKALCPASRPVHYDRGEWRARELGSGLGGLGVRRWLQSDTMGSLKQVRH